MSFHPDRYLGSSSRICCPVCKRKDYKTIGERIEEDGVAGGFDLYNAKCNVCGNEFVLVCDQNKPDPHTVIQKMPGAGSQVWVSKGVGGNPESCNIDGDGIVYNPQPEFDRIMARKRKAFREKQIAEKKAAKISKRAAKKKKSADPPVKSECKKGKTSSGKGSCKGGSCKKR